jgi:soluble lytic murein transglycosylase
VTLACALLPLVGGAAGAAEAAQQPGPALRAALQESAAGRPQAAADAFEAAATRWPLVGDHALRLAAEARLEAGDSAGALQAVARLERAHPDSPLLSDAAGLAAEAYLASGDRASAIDAYRRAHARAHTTAERRALRASLARTLEDAGRDREAREDWLVIWTQVPGTEEDDLAVVALARLEARGAPPPSAQDWAKRAEAFAEAHEPERAVDAYDRALAGTLPKSERERMVWGRAFALFRARRYPEATAAFETLGTDPEARLFRARSLARSGELERSIQAFEEVGRGSSSHAWRARLLVATLLDDAPETRDRAAIHYEAVAAGGSSSEQRREATWRMAWLQRSEGDLAAAASSFERLAGGDPLPALGPRYWAARTRAEIDPSAEGPALELAELARHYPLTYYGWRAAERAGDPALARPEPAALTRGRRTLAGAPIARVRILLEAGLQEAAGDEVVTLERKARSLADRLLLADLAAAAARPDRARALAASGNDVALARGPAPGLEELWWHAWPRPWRSEVDSAGSHEGVEADLVWAIMREESSFRPVVVSPSGAHGLLQLMPETASQLAPALGLAAPEPRQLDEPDLNVRLGTHLLGRLQTRFGSRRSAVIGGYNAGGAAVERWLRERPELPDDEWVDSIPYDETRDYVRRVLRSLHAYRVLY